MQRLCATFWRINSSATNCLQATSDIQSATVSFVLRRCLVAMQKVSKTRLVLLVALMATFLVVAARAGSVWHHHATSAAETSCVICHLGHQPFQHPAVIQSAPVLLAIGPGPLVAEPVLRPEPDTSRAAT
jgi:hypothetical protein